MDINKNDNTENKRTLNETFSENPAESKSFSSPENDASSYNAEVAAGGSAPKGEDPVSGERLISKAEKKKLEKEEKKQWDKRKKTKKALKSYRGRRLKNFLIWFTGVLCSIIIIAGGTFAAVKFIPLKTFVGEPGDTISANIYDRSALDALLKINDYTLNDLPIVKNALLDFAHDDEISQYVTVDEEALGNVKLTNIGSGLAECFNLDKDNIKLSAFYPISASSQKTYDILIEGIGGGKTAEEFTVGDIENFDINNVTIGTVLGDTYTSGTNPILDAMLARGVTISELSDALNNLAISEIYDTDCFTTDISEAKEGSTWNLKYEYDSTTGNYTLSATGTYYVKSSASVWIFLLYDFETTGGELGRPGTYVNANVTFGGMESRVNGIASSITSATIRQLVDAGILAGGYSNPSVYESTLDGVLGAL